jgi:hypothetical protein
MFSTAVMLLNLEAPPPLVPDAASPESRGPDSKPRPHAAG